MPALSELIVLFPEILLSVAGMGLLVWGVFMGEGMSRLLGRAVVLILLIALLAESFHDGQRLIVMSGLFIDDSYSAFMNSLVLLASALTLIFYFDDQDRLDGDRIEYPILVLFATLGMMMMIAANDLLAVYLGIELQSLALYVLAAIQRDNLRASEAGLKYFVLGALSSGLLLYGISLIYGFAGSTNFTILADVLAAPGMGADLGIVFGLAFVMAGLAFKVSAAPFHMWTPDVYEGAPTPVTAFFAVAPKIAAVALLIRVVTGPFEGLGAAWTQIVVFLAVLSMIVGSFGALNQTNIKRLMAYSSIGHVGFALLGLAAGTPEGIAAIILYMTIYLFMTVGVFAVILCMRRQARMIETIDDLAGLSKSHPFLAAVMAILMFSMAGIPPLAGFFAKFAVFMAVVNAGLLIPAVIGVLASVVAAYYYLRIVKLMYFDDLGAVFDRVISRDIRIILGVTALFVLLFFVYPAPVLEAAARAADAVALGRSL